MLRELLGHGSALLAEPERSQEVFAKVVLSAGQPLESNVVTSQCNKHVIYFPSHVKLPPIFKLHLYVRTRTQP